MRETAQMKDLSAHARDESEVFNALHKASTARQRERPRPQSLCSRAGQCSTLRVYFRHLRRVRIVKPANSLSILKKHKPSPTPRLQSAPRGSKDMGGSPLGSP